MHIVTSTAQFPDEHPAHQKKIYEYYTPTGVLVTVFNVRYSHFMSIPRRLWAFGEFFVAALFYLRSKTKQYDLIYASSTPPSIGILAYLMTWFCKIPFVLEVVDVWPDVPIGMGIVKNKLIIKLLDFGMNVIYHRAKKIIALSPGMKTQICAHRVPEQKVWVSYNGTDTNHFFPERNNPEKPQNKLITFLYAGTIGYANQLTQLFPLANEFLKRNIDVEFRIIGNGNNLNEFLAELKEKKLPNIAYQSAVPKQEIARIMQKATFGIVCFAPYEVLEANSANKFYDYLACGLPVVINYKGWQAELLTQHNCGFSGGFQNPETIVNELVSVISDTHALSQMRQNARHLALSRFDRTKIATELLNILKTLTTTELQPKPK